MSKPQSNAPDTRGSNPPSGRPRLAAPHIYPSKLYSSFSLDGDPVCAALRARRKEPLFIVCPGPTSLEINPELVAGQGVLFRMNTFYFEETPRFGRFVDGYFCSNGEPAFYDELEKAVVSGGYSIGAFFSPLIIRLKENNPERVDKLEKLFQPASDHWAVIATNPVLAREMMGRPLPTQAFQVLAAGAILGFEEIHLIGVDMYSDPARRYAYDYPERMKAKVDEKHYKPSYEAGAHGHERDLIFLESILAQFPDTRIYNASRVSPLRDYLPLSPLAEGKPAGSAGNYTRPSPSAAEKSERRDLRYYWNRFRHWAYPFKVRLYRAFGRKM